MRKVLRCYELENVINKNSKEFVYDLGEVKLAHNNTKSMLIPKQTCVTIIYKDPYDKRIQIQKFTIRAYDTNVFVSFKDGLWKHLIKAFTFSELKQNEYNDVKKKYGAYVRNIGIVDGIDKDKKRITDNLQYNGSFKSKISKYVGISEIIVFSTIVTKLINGNDEFITIIGNGSISFPESALTSILHDIYCSSTYDYVISKLNEDLNINEIKMYVDSKTVTKIAGYIKNYRNEIIKIGLLIVVWILIVLILFRFNKLIH